MPMNHLLIYHLKIPLLLTRIAKAFILLGDNFFRAFSTFKDLKVIKNILL